MANRYRNQSRDGRSTPKGSHVPVLLREVLDQLQPAEGKVLADITLGHGGHSRAVIERMAGTGTLIVMDLDGTELARTVADLPVTGTKLIASQGNFAGLPQVLGENGLAGVDGLLADLGVSSMQIDDADRGFSYRRDGPLDMRMDRSRGETAQEILAKIDENTLAESMIELADEPRARHLARAIVAARQTSPFTSTTQLADFCEEALAPPGTSWRLRQGQAWVTHPAARLFQTLRLLVNREISNLKHLLRTLPDVLAPGGTACIISFHSGEDRLIKQAFRDGLRTGQYDAIADEPMLPTDYEKKGNPRSRSAKLRWAHKAENSEPET
jgi:16S rRNA (cytosine1402-N4)-methyltransferase